MLHCVLVISDVHLSRTTISSSADQDKDLASLIVSAANNIRYGSVEIVFNGDLFDFDAPDGANDVHSALRRIAILLHDHPLFVQAINTTLSLGCSVIFIAGNHDAQLAFPIVRNFLQQKFGHRVSVRTWFHQTSDGIHIEHGHFYDPLCVLGPPITDTAIVDTLGSVASRHATSILPDLKSNAIDPFTSARLVINQTARLATAKFLRDLLSVKPKFGDAEAFTQTVRIETGANPYTLAAHAALIVPQMSLTEFVHTKGWIGYGKTTINRLQAASCAIAQIYGSRAVVMGHTHYAYGLCESGTFFANSGCWPPPTGFPSFSPQQAGSYVWIENDNQSMRANIFSWPCQSWNAT